MLVVDAKGLPLDGAGLGTGPLRSLIVKQAASPTPLGVDAFFAVAPRPLPTLGDRL